MGSSRCCGRPIVRDGEHCATIGVADSLPHEWSWSQSQNFWCRRHLVCFIIIVAIVVPSFAHCCIDRDNVGSCNVFQPGTPGFLCISARGGSCYGIGSSRSRTIVAMTVSFHLNVGLCLLLNRERKAEAGLEKYW